MGVGEGNNEMPDHLLDELRKRAIYYKSETPKEIQVMPYSLVIDYRANILSSPISLVNIHFEMADFVPEKILSPAHSMD